MEERDLERMTATKLREEAKKYPDIKGAHAMKKDELIKAIRAAGGEAVEEKKPKGVKKKKKTGVTIPGLKKQIRALKAEKVKALEEGNRESLRQLREKIKKMKRLTRKLATAEGKLEGRTKEHSA